MLDTRFPRIEGDIGNAAVLRLPGDLPAMKGIGSADAVTPIPTGRACSRRSRPMPEALAAEGAVGLSTSCGFLALYRTISRPVAGAGRDLGVAA